MLVSKVSSLFAVNPPPRGYALNTHAPSAIRLGTGRACRTRRHSRKNRRKARTSLGSQRPKDKQPFLGCRMSVPQTTNHQQRGGGGVPNDNEPARIPLQARQLIVAEVQRGYYRGYQNVDTNTPPSWITGILTPNNTLSCTHFLFHFPNSPSARYAAVAPSYL